MNGLTNTRTAGKVLVRLAEVGSTNEHALALLSSKIKPAEGTAVFSDNQTAGRGQIGSRWHSAPGLNIAISFIFYPNWLETGQQWLLSEMAAVAVRDFLAGATGLSPKIKWPNDLYFFDKKAGGILIQNSIGGGRMESSVIGTGINANQTEWPAELPNPTSMKNETGRGFDLLPLVEGLCDCFDNRYRQLKSDPASIQKDYLQNLYRLGETAAFETADGHVFFGKITGVRPGGRLIVEQANGQETDWEAKQIRFAL